MDNKVEVVELGPGQLAVGRPPPPAATPQLHTVAVCVCFCLAYYAIPKRHSSPLQAVYLHGGQLHRVQPLRTAEDANLVCDALTGECCFAASNRTAVRRQAAGMRAGAQPCASTWCPSARAVPAH